MNTQALTERERFEAHPQMQGSWMNQLPDGTYACAEVQNLFEFYCSVWNEAIQSRADADYGQAAQEAVDREAGKLIRELPLNRDMTISCTVHYDTPFGDTDAMYRSYLEPSYQSEWCETPAQAIKMVLEEMKNNEPKYLTPKEPI